jgi:flagellar basal-body rod protein FlgG
MIDALYISATGMQAQQLNVDVIANNLANVNTSGFKKNKVTFQDAYYRAMTSTSNIDAVSQSPIMLGMGAMVSSNSKSFTQGEIKATESPLDLAIRGAGFFEVLMQDGSAGYTRFGALKVTENGVLGTASGYELKQQIEIPADILEVVVDSSGKVSGRVAKDKKLIELGQLELTNFPSLDGLNSIGDNLYTANESAGQKITSLPGEEGFGTIAQGYLESSNVKLAEEMIGLVLAQRAYELNAKVIQASDDMLAISNNLRR